eukprot:11196372-Ditylum_brightwellii.AAC.1
MEKFSLVVLPYPNITTIQINPNPTEITYTPTDHDFVVSTDDNSDYQNNDNDNPNNNDDMIDSTDTQIRPMQSYGMIVNIHVSYINSLE